MLFSLASSLLSGWTSRKRNVRRGDVHLGSETIALSVVGWRWRLLPQARTDSSADGDGRLQSLELVLCECSRAEPLHPTIATDQRTAAGKRRKNEQRCKIWCKACINLHPPDISIHNLMTHKVIKNSHLSFYHPWLRRNLMNGNEERILDGLNKQLSFCTTQDVLCTKSGAGQLASSTSTAYLNNFTMLICCLHLFCRVTFKMIKAIWGSVIARIPKSQGDTALHSLSPDNFSLWSESANSTYWRKSLLEFCASCTRPPTPPWLRHPCSLSSLLSGLWLMLSVDAASPSWNWAQSGAESSWQGSPENAAISSRESVVSKARWGRPRGEEWVTVESKGDFVARFSPGRLYVLTRIFLVLGGAVNISSLSPNLSRLPKPWIWGGEAGLVEEGEWPLLVEPVSLPGGVRFWGFRRFNAARSSTE